MKYSVSIILFVLTGLAVVLLFGLVRWTDKPNGNKNGFNRKIAHDTPYPIFGLYRTESINSITGGTKNTLYFSGREANRVFAANHRLSLLNSIILPMQADQLELSAYDVVVDSPHVSIYFKNASTIISGALNGTNLKKTKLETPLFTRSVSVSNSSEIMRAFNSSRINQIIQKVSKATGKSIDSTKLLSDNDDGGFSSDGLLLYDTLMSCVLYLQHYQNNFYCLDTNLNVLYSSKTIDTTNTNIARTRTFSSKLGGSIMPSAPLYAVNIDGCVANGRLYVMSDLKSDNESVDKFSENVAIDVYDIQTGNYIHSFYIVRPNHLQAKQLRVFGNTLVVLFSNCIATYIVST